MLQPYSAPEIWLVSRLCTITLYSHNNLRQWKVQEINRPGTALSHASNLCTAVGGIKTKNSKNIAIVFSKLTRKPKIVCIRSNWIY